MSDNVYDELLTQKQNKIVQNKFMVIGWLVIPCMYGDITSAEAVVEVDENLDGNGSGSDYSQNNHRYRLFECVQQLTLAQQTNNAIQTNRQMTTMAVSCKLNER